MSAITTQNERALKILVEEILTQLNEVASLKAQGYRAELSVLLLSEMCQILKELDEPMQQRYFAELLETAGRKRPEIPQGFNEQHLIAGIQSKRRVLGRLQHYLSKAA